MILIELVEHLSHTILIILLSFISIVDNNKQSFLQFDENNLGRAAILPEIKRNLLPQSQSITGKLLSITNNTIGCTEFSGTSILELFSVGKKAFTIKEAFNVIYDGDNWFISTKFIESEPKLSPVEIGSLAPPFLQLGTDGIDLYFLYKGIINTVEVDSGKVEPGKVMSEIYGSDLSLLLWQTYGFGNIIKSNDVNELTPPWSTDDDNAVRAGKDNVPIKYIRSKKNPLFVEKLEFTYKNLVKKDEGNTGSEQNDPFHAGYSPWVYQITEYLTISNIFYPKEFKSEMFQPKKDSDGSYKLETMKSISGKILSFKTGVKKSDWLPKLTGNNMIVSDKRFTTVVTNWSSVSYYVTNQWYNRSHPIVYRAVRTYMNAILEKEEKISN